MEIVVFAGFGSLSYRIITNSKHIVEKVRSKGIPVTLAVVRIPALDEDFEPFVKLGDEEIYIPALETNLDQIAEEIATKIAEKLGFTLVSGFPVYSATAISP